MTLCIAVVAFSANNSNLCIFSLKNKIYKLLK